MAKYTLVDKAQLESDLGSVADSIRAKAGLSSTKKLDFPNEFKSVVDGISSGVNVQTKSGSFTTNTSGTGSASCGFKPDAVFLFAKSSSFSGYMHTAAAFTEKGVTSQSVYIWAPSSNYAFSNYTINQNSSGFSVTGKKYDTTFNPTNDSSRSLEYLAIKYT